MVDFKKKLEELKARNKAQQEVAQQVIVTPAQVTQQELEIKKEVVDQASTEKPQEVVDISQTNPAGFLLKQKVGELNAAMLENHPRMPVLLKEIWLAIRKQPEQVTVLSPEETHTVFQGIERQTGVFLATSVTATKASTGTNAKMAKLKQLGADAF